MGGGGGGWVGGATAVVATAQDGTETTYPATDVISSMPFARLVDVLDPPPPADVVEAAHGLSFRDFLTVALIYRGRELFPDNWIYVHARDVGVGRIQNFGSWSPYLVKEGRTCLGLEYFVFEGQGLWAESDDALIALVGRLLDEGAPIDGVGLQGGQAEYIRIPHAGGTLYPLQEGISEEELERLRKLGYHARKMLGAVSGARAPGDRGGGPECGARDIV